MPFKAAFAVCSLLVSTLVPGILCVPLAVDADAAPSAVQASSINTGVMSTKTIMVVSDHGTGSSSFVAFLNSNGSCVLNGNEPFGEELEWSWGNFPSHPDKSKPALFNFETGAKQNEYAKNHKLATRLGQAALKKHKDWDLNGLEQHIEKVFKQHVHKLSDVATYFHETTEYACAAMPNELKQQCDNKCAVAYKFFPRYVGGNTDFPHTLNRSLGYDGDKPDNARALQLWKESLQSMKSHSSVVTTILSRDEQAREFSNFRRFDTGASFFDCTTRPVNRFLQMASEMMPEAHVTDSTKCLQELNSALACLNRVMKLGGVRELTTEDFSKAFGFLARRVAEQAKVGSKAHATCADAQMLLKSGGVIRAATAREMKEKMTELAEKQHASSGAQP